IDGLLDAALAQALELTNCDAGEVYLLDARTQTLALRAHRSLMPECTPPHEQASLENEALAQIAFAEAPTYLERDKIAACSMLLSQPYSGVKAATFIPLRAKGNTVGLMSISVRSEPVPTALNTDSLAAIGNQIGIAIENARLYEAERQAHQTAATLSQALTAVTSTLELSEVLSLVLEQLAHVVAYDSAAVMLLTDDGFDTLLTKKWPGVGQRQHKHTSVPFVDRKAAWRVTQDRKPLILFDVSEAAEWTSVEKMHYIRSWMGTPLVIRDETIGVLTVDKTVPHYYTEKHLELLETFANQVALAIEKARLYEAIKTELAERTTLHEVTRAVSSTLDLEAILRAVLDAAIRATGAERGYVVLLDSETGGLAPCVARNLDQETIARDDFQVSRTIVERVALDGIPILTVNAQEDPRFADRPSVIDYDLRSILCVPLLGKGQVIGSLYLDNRLKIGQFGQRDLDLLQAIAGQSATAIENATLYGHLKETNARLARKIEEVNRAYEQLQETQAQLIRAEKQAAVVELAGATAHELNQPLTVLQGLATLLSKDIAIEEGSHLWRDLQAIREATSRAAEIVRRLGRITSYETKPYVGSTRIIDLERAVGNDECNDNDEREEKG
ncbi:MAG: GAF domain-containing protein, partial [Chloroflexota bacterium]|nr:GAF domain-containing protein [Chloroflexota bacterium]